MAKGESKTSARRVKAVERQAAAVKLRILGADYRTIAAQLDFAGPSGAYQAVAAALRKTLIEPTAELRTLELARLDRLWESAFKLATIGGDVSAISAAVRISERRSRLAGLDAVFKFSTADVQELAAELISVLEREVGDEQVLDRVFEALGFVDGRAVPAGRP